MPPPAELERVFQDHHERVFQAAYRVTGSLADAEDVLQNVFLRLLRRGVLPNRSEKLGSYLHRAAVNASIDLLRGRKSTRSVPLETVKGQLREGSELHPDEREAARELHEWFRSALCQLSPQSAEILLLRYFEGYANREIAEIVGTSQGVVAVVLHRARHRLKDQLRSFLGGTP